MFCKNCGEYVEDNQGLCKKCGIAVGEGMNFCSNCGSPMNKQTFVCDTCGMRDSKIVPAQGKSKLTAALLALFLGGFGAHNFYLGFKNKAVIQLVLSIISTLLKMMKDFAIIATVISIPLTIWIIAEMILILIGKIDKDSSGLTLK